ncbi:MAG: hypothetical protein KA714_10645 [Limnoraphis sp. WC205]|jgi:hypothetical protein|nr:hypothetical protein [Limnoraphis sp. WC205]
MNKDVSELYFVVEPYLDKMEIRVNALARIATKYVFEEAEIDRFTVIGILHELKTIAEMAINDLTEDKE